MKFKELRNVLFRYDKFNIGRDSNTIECNGCTIDKTIAVYNLGDKDVLYITPTAADELYIALK